MSERKTFQKTEIYKNGNFTVATYDFEIPNGSKA